MAEDLTIQILIQIRDGIERTNERLERTNERLDRTRLELSERLERTNERLDRVVHEQIRHATAIVEFEQGQRAMLGALLEMRDDVRGLNSRIDNVLTGPVGSMVKAHEARISDLTERVQRLEKASAKPAP